MGISQSKKICQSNDNIQMNYNICIIKLNNNFMITDYIDHSNILGYDKDYLINQYITILMNDVTKNQHLHIFNKIKKMDINEIRKKIKLTMDNIRILQIKNMYDIYIPCLIDIELNIDYSSIIKIRHAPNNIHFNCPSKISQYLDGQNKLIMNNHKDIICINIDIANSTQFFTMKDTEQIMMFYYNLNYEIDKIISEYYPYLHLHETCGDSYLLLINILKKHKDSINLSIEISKRIMTCMNSFLYDYNQDSLYGRCGIIKGELSTGTIDGKTFRIFGSIVHKVSRLQSNCEKNNICFDESIYHYINNTQQLKCKKINKNLKGFGNIDTYQLDIYQ